MGVGQRKMEDLVMENSLGEKYKGRTVLVTGHTGFKGSWLCLWLAKAGAKVIGYSIDYPGTPSHFKLLDLDITSITGDILDAQSLQKCFNEHQPEIVFHLAAQSLVRESYKNPLKTYSTNVIGTLNVFEAARKCKSVKAIVNVTTDKVYENIEQDIAYKETDRLGGYDIYSSSKACSEILTVSYKNSFLNVNEYKKTHGILLATARAGNVIGGGDWAADRLVPDVIKASVNNQPVVIRNLGSVRPWQHVLEPISGYLLLGARLLEENTTYAESWNFGPDYQQCVSVESLLNLLKSKWENIIWEHKPETGNFHEATLLKLDSSKSKKLLNWKPLLDIDETLELTVNWYRNYYENNSLNSADDINYYMKKALAENILV